MRTPIVAPSSNARSVDAGRGLAWRQEAWTLIMKAPGTWTVVTLIALVATLLLAMLPLVGQFLLSLVAPGVSRHPGVGSVCPGPDRAAAARAPLHLRGVARRVRFTV